MSTLIVNTNHITAQCANWLTEQGLLIVLNCWAMQVELCTNNRFTGSSYDHRVRSLVMLFFLSWLIFFDHKDRLWYWFQSILNSKVELMHLNCLNLLPKANAMLDFTWACVDQTFHYGGAISAAVAVFLPSKYF